MSFTLKEQSILKQIFGVDAFNNDPARLYGDYRVAIMPNPDATTQLKLRRFVECLHHEQTTIDGQRISEHTINKHRALIIRFLKTYLDELPSYVVPPYIFINTQLLSIWCDALNNNNHLIHIQVECSSPNNTEEQQLFLQTLATMPQLRDLTIVGFDFNRGRMQVLVAAMRNLVFLTALAIEDCKLDIDAGVSLASIVNTSKIHDLTLRRIMYDETITLGNIINALESQALKFLRLDNNAIVEKDLDLLIATFSRLPQLKLLNLKNTGWGDKGLTKLTQLITANKLPALETLCLIDNGITDEGARPLLTVLLANKTLLDTVMLGSSDHFHPENTDEQYCETKMDWEARLDSRFNRGKENPLSYFISIDKAVPNKVNPDLQWAFKIVLEPKFKARIADMPTPTITNPSEQVASTSSSSSTILHFAGPVPLFPGITELSSSPSCSSTPTQVACDLRAI